nr:GrpB family protein [Streptomyces sp. SID14478]
MPAKDVIDIQVRVVSVTGEEAQTARLAALMARIGFRLRPEPWSRQELPRGATTRKLVFAPHVGARPCNVHLRQDGGPGARYALLFRSGTVCGRCPKRGTRGARSSGA